MMDFIIISPDSADIVELLLEHGANPNTADSLGIAPIMTSVQRGN